ncbi:hypothetical protein BABINDRAFT_161495 [Babjeviella inositovora NRRL Y-12698]|uniref:Uncharacterized protein n=1 Tax=Babjeviella inositovora NRRL Y-12698 TaxID=984486 RepID=A0A1E3QQ62_9ASCO|nr:uncharacterized protein BABINDRAFT_161495 [Babjeviella inositovora NRRL Y-12698]ODQ79801.1 hypothetical protein BABINDRAFT_161495 [Babjeviella inositovora NRRL Y-12698]
MISPSSRHSKTFENTNTLSIPNDYNPYTVAKHRRSQSNQTGFSSVALEDLDLIPENRSVPPTAASNSTLRSKLITSSPPNSGGSLSPKVSDYTFSAHKASRKADHDIKLVVVGDGGCGKTCLLVSYTQNKFPEIYVPTIFETYLAQMLAPDSQKHIALSLWDTAGQEEYDRLRPLSYPDVDIILACFSLTNQTSLQNIKDAWVPELNHFCPGVPVLLVGTKSDLESSITNDQIMSIAQQVNAIGFVKCSAKTMSNVRNVFNFALDYVTKNIEKLEVGADKNSKRWSKRLSRNFDASSAGGTAKGHRRNTSTNPMEEPTQEYHKNSEYYIASDQIQTTSKRKSRKCTIL